MRMSAPVWARRSPACRSALHRRCESCLDEIDARGALGDRVFDLNARIDLDEIELAGVGVLQKFHRAGGPIAHGAADLERRLAQIAALRVAQKRRRRAFHDLLIAALHCAVAFEQVHEVAVRVADDLHLDMARAAHEFLEIDLVLAEGRLRLAPRSRNRLDQGRVVLDDAHAAAAAAPARLEHDGEADRPRHGEDCGIVVGQRRGRRHDRARRLFRRDCVRRPCCRAGASCRAAARRTRCRPRRRLPRVPGFRTGIHNPDGSHRRALRRAIRMMSAISR
jgi:hypothetical protein